MKKIVFSLLIFTLCVFISLSPLSASATQNSTPSSGEFMEELNSESALLIHLESETVLYEKEPSLEVEPVFLTKLMIALLTLETVDNETLTVGQNETREEVIEKKLDAIPVTAPDYIFEELTRLGSSQPNIRTGETLSVFQLLNLLLVPSGNDAAMVLADYLGEGNIPAVVDQMNKRAKELGATNTFFTNVHGFHDPEQITTVHDIYKITKPLLAKTLFMKIVEQNLYRLEPTNKSKKARSFPTTNLMMNNSGSGYYYRPIKGIKTGRNDNSGFCVASYAVRDNVSYFCVMMGAPARDSNGNLVNTNGAFKDTTALCSWAFSNFETKTIIKEGDSVAQISLKYAWNQDKLVLTAASDFASLLPKSVNPKTILLIPNVPESLEAPVTAGDVIGTVDIMYAGKKIGTINAVASMSAEKNTMQVVSDLVDSIINSVWLYIGLGVLVLGLGIYAVLFFLSNRRNRRKVTRPRQRNRRF